MMSTKIYNGYRLKMMSLHELQDFTKRFRYLIQEKAIEIAGRNIVGKAVQILDLAMQHDKKQFFKKAGSEFSTKETKMDDSILSHNAISVAFRHFLDRWKEAKKSGQRDPEVDLDCSVCFIPIARKILCLFYAEQKEYQELWESLPEVKEYAYYTNSDRPEHISARDWRQRGMDWDLALPGVGIPSMNGLTIECVHQFSPYYDFKRENTESYIPDIESRLTLYAIDSAIRRHMESANKDDIISKYIRANRWVRSEDGKSTLEQERSIIRPRLKESFSKEDLLSRPIGDFIKPKYFRKDKVRK